MSRPNSDHPHGAEHDEWDELAVGYALTALEPDEMERFIEHLVSFCPQCQQSVDDTAQVGAGLAAALPISAAGPSNGLRDSVLAAAFAARPPVPQSTADFDRMGSVTAMPTRPTPVSDHAPTPSRASGAHRVIDLSERRERRTARSAGWLVAAAAAVVALVVSVTAVVSTRSNSRTAADAAYRTAVSTALSSSGQVVALKDTSGANIASVVTHSNSVSVVSLKMVPNSKSTSYVLWGINGTTANPIALGVFDVGSHSVQTAKVQTDSRGYSSFTSYAVSHEKGHTAPTAPTSIVATGTK